MNFIYRWCVPSEAFATDRWAVLLDELRAVQYGLAVIRERIATTRVVIAKTQVDAERLATWIGRTR